MRTERKTKWWQSTSTVFCTISLLAFCLISCQGGNKTDNKETGGDSIAASADADFIDEFATYSAEERDSLAIRLIEEFYSQAPKPDDTYKWDKTVLQRYLAPRVLQTLRDSIGSNDTIESEEEFATWLLTGIDDSEQIIVRKQTPTEPVGDGRYKKSFQVTYWSDAIWGDKDLYFTVGGTRDHLLITRIDSLGLEATQSVWKQLEERDRWREVERMAEEMGGMESLSDDVLDSLYEHALD